MSVRPWSALSVIPRIENAGALVRPMTIAPARRRLPTWALSSGAIRSFSFGTPLSVGRPAWSVLIFVVIGRPWSAPSGSPASRARSAVSASASACS
ncbi:MAG TPA: hypothetical protein PKA95_09270 [Thermomicrobiales bacterium]|nr:hypothetical protein [Thermomicrobiales bacterium]